MKVLIVGGAGYIGSHMALMLSQQGAQVIVLDDLSSGHADAVLSTRLVQGSIEDTGLLDRLFADETFDGVMHFASFIQVGESVQHPAKYYRNNVTHTINLLDAMIRHRVKNFIFSSTAAIFGQPEYIPIDEAHPKQPINPYGRTKLMVEQVLQDYDIAYGFKSVCLRYFNAAGADPQARIGETHDPETHLIPLLLQVTSGRRQSAQIFGVDYDTPDGTCIRDYVHVLDLAAVHSLALAHLISGGASAVYNLGNGNGFSVRQVIETVRQVTMKPVPVIHAARRPGDPARLVADAALARKHLGWTPLYPDLSTIVSHAWNWERKNRGRVNAQRQQMANIKQQVFGEMPDGRNVKIYTLTNDQGLEARIMNYGGTLVSLRAPDRNGVHADVVLGFDVFAPYLSQHPYFGSLIGRYANRIAGASFTIDGRTYRLSANDGRNHLHGGRIGFDKILWDAKPAESAEGPQLVLSHFSRAGEDGYPGSLSVRVTYTLTAQNELRLDYSASTDHTTVINLTHHSYFNLAGAGTIHDHLLHLAAERYLPVDPELIPLSEQRSVRSTPFDFTVARSIGSGINSDDPQLQLAGGYDHCWILTEQPGACALAAKLFHPMSGRALSVFTTQPGIQVYSGNFLDGSIQGKRGRRYQRHSGLCLETQHFPDSPNQPSFPTTILEPGQTYREMTVYRFEVDQGIGEQKT